MFALGCLLKGVFCFLNTVLFISGLLMTVGGAFLRFPPDSIKEAILSTLNSTMEKADFNLSTPLTEDDLKNMPLISEVGLTLFILGMILTLVSALGLMCLCFACCNSLMIGFTVIMIIMIILELVMFDIFFAEESHLHESIRTELKSKIASDFTDSRNNSFSATMVLLHTHFNCCGIDGVEDFGRKNHSSCAIEHEKTGCYTKMTAVLMQHKTTGIAIIACLVLVELVEVILSLVIIKSNKVFPLF